MTTTTYAFGELLKGFRQREGLTQTDLGNHLGVHRNSVSVWERSTYLPGTREMVLDLADALTLSPAEADQLLRAAQYPPATQVHTETTPVTRSDALIDRRNDWSDAPDISNFCGRQAEVACLHQWLLDERCRLVGVLGIGGIGKTSLVTKIAEEVEGAFDHVIWRSLRNAPPLSELLTDLSAFFLSTPPTELPDEFDKRISLLMEHLRRKRCLLILDNVESILQAGDQAGHFRLGYQDYGQLLQRVGESHHQSCLLLTSREKPRQFSPLESEQAPVRTLHLGNMGVDAGRALLERSGLRASSAADWHSLVERYSGNPLALKLMAETVSELFAGDVVAFLEEEVTIFGGIRALLSQQFERLSILEQEMLVWLAIEREPIGLSQISDNLVQSVPRRRLLEAARNLRRRSLLERTGSGFTLQNVVMEFLTDFLVESVCAEIRQLATDDLDRPSSTDEALNRFALIKAQSRVYVHASQERLILTPVVNCVKGALGEVKAVARLKEIAANLVSHTPGYAGGNILNLLLSIGADLAGMDFSSRAVWQVYMTGHDVQGVDFSHADLSGASFSQTFDHIMSVAFSSNGELIASGGTDQVVRLWDAHTYQELGQLRGHTVTIWSVAFSPDGSRIASGSQDATVRVWDVQSGQEFLRLAHSKTVNAVTFSPDGRLIASASNDSTVRIWDAHSGRELFRYSHRHSVDYSIQHSVNSVAFSPDSKHLASADNHYTNPIVQIRDVSDGRELHQLDGHTTGVTSVAFSPDGTRLVSGSWDETVRIWDTKSGRELHQLLGHSVCVSSVAFSPDGRQVVSGGRDATIRIWDVDSGRALQEMLGHSGEIHAVAVSPDDGRIVSGGLDMTIRVWDAPSASASTGSQALALLQGHSSGLCHLAYEAGGKRLATAGWDRVVRIWNAEDGQKVHVLRDHADPVEVVAFSPDGSRIASGGWDNVLRIWDTDSGRQCCLMKGHDLAIRSLSYSPDGCRIASSGEEHIARFWDANSGQELGQLVGHASSVKCITYSPDGGQILTGSYDESIRVWDADSGVEIARLLGHTSGISCIVFSPDRAKILSGSWDNTIRVWDAENHREIGRFVGHEDAVFSITCSLDGKLIASASADQTIRVWDAFTFEEVHRLLDHSHEVWSVSFILDDTILASCSIDGTIRYWDVQTWDCVRILRADRPYERTKITGVTGLTDAQIRTLKVLGAVGD